MQPSSQPEDRVVDDDGNTDALEALLNRWTNRTPEQKRIDRENAMKHVRKSRPLPEGKTLSDVLVGQWPGDETDEKIRQALDKLS